MVHRPLGRTGLSTAPVAFGAFKIGRNQKIKYARAYDLPSDADTDRLLNAVLDMGINLIDTAPAYGTSEQRIGQFIGHRRKEYILSSKAGETFENGASTYDFSRQAIIHSVHRSLKRLRTEVLDLVFLHSNDDAHVLNQTDAAATLQSLKEQGLVRFIGLSGKTLEGARQAMQWADALMLEFHPADSSLQPAMDEAAVRGVAVLVKKPLASGQIPSKQAIPFILGNSAVSTLVIGSLNADHLRENLRLACG